MKALRQIHLNCWLKCLNCIMNFTFKPRHSTIIRYAYNLLCKIERRIWCESIRSIPSVCYIAYCMHSHTETHPYALNGGSFTPALLPIHMYRYLEWRNFPFRKCNGFLSSSFPCFRSFACSKGSIKMKSIYTVITSY